MRPSRPIRNLKGETALPPGADLRCNKCERVKDDREATPKLLHLQYPSLGDSSVLEARKFFAQELIVRLVRAWSLSVPPPQDSKQKFQLEQSSAVGKPSSVTKFRALRGVLPSQDQA